MLNKNKPWLFLAGFLLVGYAVGVNDQECQEYLNACVDASVNAKKFDEDHECDAYHYKTDKEDIIACALKNCTLESLNKNLKENGCKEYKLSTKPPSSGNTLAVSFAMILVCFGLAQVFVML